MNKVLFGAMTAGLLGLAGVSIGLKLNHAVETKADANTVRIYLNLNTWAENWDLFSEASNVNAHYYGGTGATTWPGTRMTKCDGVDGLYYLDIKDDNTRINFLVVDDGNNVKQRVVNDGCNDISLPIGNYETKNMFNLYHVGYNDWTYAGSWDYRDTEVADGAYLRGDWGEDYYGWSKGGQRKMTTVTEGSEYVIENVILGAGGTIKTVIYNSGITTWITADTVSSTDDDAYPVSIVDDGKGNKNVTVTNAGTYTVTLSKEAGKWNYGFEGTSNPNLDAAIGFANDFKNAMKDACPATAGDGDISGAWATEAIAFDELDPQAQNYLLDKESTVSQITEFQARYTSIYGAYGTKLSLANFASSLLSPAQVNASLAPVENTSLGLIVGSASVATIGLSGFFFLRKRKAE